jgi:hypothetical protein
MKIVRNTSPWPYKDNNWAVNVNFSNETVTVNVVTTQIANISVATPTGPGNTEVEHSTVTSSVEFGNVTASFNLTDLRSNFVDHGAFVMLSNKHPAVDLPQTDFSQVVQNQATTVQELFQLTGPAKIRFKDLRGLYDKLTYATLVVPFSDSTDDELILMIRDPSNANVQLTTSGFSGDLGTVSSNAWQTGVDQSGEPGWLSLYPTLISPALTVGVNTTTQFSVQLANSDGTPMQRAGVTLYLDNTGGTLTSNRIITDSTGVATGTIVTTSIPTTFKIKVGFKYFSGVLDIPVTVS